MKAYLIVMCDKDSNAILGADIWSSPEWEQSRRLDGCYTYIAYEVGADTFHNAKQELIQTIKAQHQHGYDRYYRLLKYIKELKDAISV